MKGRLTAAAGIAAIVTAQAVAAPAYVAKIPLTSGFSVFEFYMERSPLPECQGAGSNPSALTSHLETPQGMKPYGTGCWIAQLDGNIWIAVKSFQDGIVRQMTIPHTALQRPKAPEPTEHVRQLMKELEETESRCENGDSRDPETLGACLGIRSAIGSVMQEGWCRTPNKDGRGETGWAKCE